MNEARQILRRPVVLDVAHNDLVGGTIIRNRTNDLSCIIYHDTIDRMRKEEAAAVGDILEAVTSNADEYKLGTWTNCQIANCYWLFLWSIGEELI